MWSGGPARTDLRPRLRPDPSTEAQEAATTNLEREDRVVETCRRLCDGRPKFLQASAASLCNKAAECVSRLTMQ
jgi:hypothetical protein